MKQKIENNLRNILRDINILDLQCVRFHFGKKFTYLIIEFNSELHEDIQKFIQISTKPQPHEEILNIFENMSDIIIVSYYMTDIYLNRKIEQKIEFEIIKEIQSKEIEYNPNWSFEIINIHPFILELSSQYDLDFTDLIRSSIKAYFNEKFKRLLEKIPINIIKFDFCAIFEKGNITSSENLCNVLLEKVSKNIGRLYDNYKFPLIKFRKYLLDFDNPMQSYDTKTLELMEGYLRDLKYVLFDDFPNLFHWRLDVLTFKPQSDSNVIRLELYQPYIQYVLSPKKKLKRLLQLLEDELVFSISKVNQIRLKKEDRIKKYGKDELEERLKNIKNESEFQDLLTDILDDLGFSDITINCKRRGHPREFGKDIVFSHRNKFRSQEWNAIVVKTGKIDQPKGRKLYNYIEEIIDKGSEALRIPFKDEKGIEFPITRVFVATNEWIGDDAKLTISAKIKGSVFFIEKKTLLNLI